MMVKGSIKTPIKRRIICIKIKMNIGGKSSVPANWTKPELAPLKAKICEKAIAPVIIMNIMTVILRVWDTELTIVSKSHPLYIKRRTKQPSAPKAADSVGVAIPKNIRPITKKMIEPSGRTYLQVKIIFSENESLATS